MQMTLENASGVRFPLYGDEANYQLIYVSGLDPVKAQLNMVKVFGQDGSMFNSSELDNRNIVILLVVNGDAEANRLRIYSDFPPKSPVTVYIKTDTRNVFINGYVEQPRCNAFDRGIRAQISIVCPDPWFLDAAENHNAGTEVQDGLEFAINNTGDAPADFDLFFDTDDGWFEGLTVQLDDQQLIVEDYTFTYPSLVIRTAEQSIYDGDTSLVPYLSLDSVFPQIPVGDSTVKMRFNMANVERFQTTLNWRNRYGGV